MRPRYKDDDTEGYKNWPFMSVQTWGENPHGQWKLEVYDNLNVSLRFCYFWKPVLFGITSLTYNS